MEVSYHKHPIKIIYNRQIFRKIKRCGRYEIITKSIALSLSRPMGPLSSYSEIEETLLSKFLWLIDRLRQLTEELCKFQ